MSKHTIIYNAKKAEEKTYIKIPFEISSLGEGITVSYKYPDGNVVDIGLESAEQFLGWSGSNKKEIRISEHISTSGYHTSIIMSGTWNILLGLYKIEQEGCEITLEIEVKEKKRVILKADLHTHSVHSDGKNSMLKNVKIAQENGLDVLFSTDHNTTTQNESNYSFKDLIVLPGMEWTHYNGHANFLGSKKPIKSFIAHTREEVIELMREAKNNGAIVILNHPFCQSGCEWKFGFDLPFDAIEVWNGPMSKTNKLAISWWENQIKNGNKIPIVGGSDFHKAEMFRMIGAPTTVLFSESKSKTDILRAISKGNSYITMQPTELSITSSILFGDTVDFLATKTITFTFKKLSGKEEICIFNNNGLVQKIETNAGMLEIEQSLDAKAFAYYITVNKNFDGYDTLVAITNPIYNTNWKIEGEEA